MNQRLLFHDDERQAATTFTDPQLPTVAKPRLGGQNEKVLARLRKGEATNTELDQLCGRVNSRIADVRRYLEAEGKTIRSRAVDIKRGIFVYEIVNLDQRKD